MAIILTARDVLVLLCLWSPDELVAAGSIFILHVVTAKGRLMIVVAPFAAAARDLRLTA